jgi:hypothetical protein
MARPRSGRLGLLAGIQDATGATIAKSIQSGRETWLVDAAATNRYPVRCYRQADGIGHDRQSFSEPSTRTGPARQRG